MKFIVNKHEDQKQLTGLLFSLAKFFPTRAEEITSLTADMSVGATLELCPLKTNRTRPQENYYRVWSREFAKHVGLTPDEMHDEILCIHFGSEEIDTPFGMKRRPLQRSSVSSKTEYMELIDTLIRIATEMGFDIPDPKADDA